MPQSQLIIGVASLVPGLGYLLLKKWKNALITWGLLLLFALAFFFSPPESTFQQISAQLFFIVWIGQIVLAINSLKPKKIELGNYLSIAKPYYTKVKIPTNTPLRKRGYYKSKEILSAQLEKNETLQAMVPALDRALMGFGTHQYLLGITHRHFLFVDMGFSGQPKTIGRIPFSQLKNSSYHKSILMDKISIKVQESEKVYKFYISFSFREEIQTFVEKLARKIK